MVGTGPAAGLGAAAPGPRARVFDFLCVVVVPGVALRRRAGGDADRANLGLHPPGFSQLASLLLLSDVALAVRERPHAPGPHLRRVRRCARRRDRRALVTRGAAALLSLLPVARPGDGADLPVGLPVVRVHPARAPAAGDPWPARARRRCSAGAGLVLGVSAAAVPAAAWLRQAEISWQPCQGSGVPEGFPGEPALTLQARLVRAKAAVAAARGGAAVHVRGRGSGGVSRARAGAAQPGVRRAHGTLDARHSAAGHLWLLQPGDH